MKILCLLADGFEECEMVTVVDLLKRGGIEVTMASISNDIVEGTHNIKICSDLLLKNIDLSQFDGIFLPGGGDGVINLSKDERVIQIVKDFNNLNKWIIAICAAPFILEKAGIIKGKNITIYPSWKNKILSSIYSEDKVVMDGNIITSRGVGTAIDLGLFLISLFCGKDLSDKIRTSIIYH